MIDHLIRFNTEADAIADPVVGQYHYADNEASGWRGDICITGQVCWQTSADTTSTVTDIDGNPQQVTTHTYLPYWYITISKPELDMDLRNHPACMLVADRSAAQAKNPGFILYTPIPAAMLNDYNVSPMPMGSNYPFGSVE